MVTLMCGSRELFSFRLDVRGDVLNTVLKTAKASSTDSDRDKVMDFIRYLKCYAPEQSPLLKSFEEHERQLLGDRFNCPDTRRDIVSQIALDTFATVDNLVRGLYGCACVCVCCVCVLRCVCVLCVCVEVCLCVVCVCVVCVFIMEKGKKMQK